ncbi:MAG: tyrosine-type recombinase/integrase [Chthoniobacter sp.]|nr:tyrosine-type recombinase/integrase [Chthoniobacter sp.]
MLCPAPKWWKGQGINKFFDDERTIERMTEGVLGQYVSLYGAGLHADGYTRLSGRRILNTVAGFNSWLKRKRIAPAQICSKHAEMFLRYRRRGVSRPCTSASAALGRWLKLLWAHGVIPEPVMPAPTPIEKVVEDYHGYLLKERSLSWRTRMTYLPLARRFLLSKFGSGDVDLSELRAADIINYVQQCAKGLSRTRAGLTRSTVRSFLQFARYRGDLVLDLAAHVPSVAGWSLSTLPKSLLPGQVEQALACCPRSTAIGRRDYAILLLLARLGLRAAEVIDLTLEDIEWENGRITIRGKMNRLDQLPLPADVGKAIAAYLKRGRPRTSNTRRVFLLAKAPWTGFESASLVGHIASQALTRAGVVAPRKGAHVFRHTLACEMLRRGRSLSEIGEILRHRSPDTTAIYAKVDLLALQSLASPWPGGEQ